MTPNQVQSVIDYADRMTMRQFHQMPKRFLEGAPQVVKDQVLDLFFYKEPMPLDYDVVLKPTAEDTQVVGLDFGIEGSRGCHFFLEEWEARRFRERNRRRRIAWADLSEAAQKRILNYLLEVPE